MQPGQPSRTAFAAAAPRAAHQVLENASIFRDPLAIPILGQSLSALQIVSELIGVAAIAIVAARNRQPAEPPSTALSAAD